MYFKQNKTNFVFRYAANYSKSIIDRMKIIRFLK